MQSVTCAPFHPDGIEEVFAVVGESVSFFCGNTSSHGMSARTQWDRSGGPLPISVTNQDQSGLFHVSQDSSLVINKVSAWHSGDYQCSLPDDENKVIKKMRLHTLDGEV